MFVYLGLPWVFVASPGLCAVAVRGLLPSCGVLASVAAERELWGTPASEAVPHGLIAPWHVASSQTSDRVCVSRLGMQILYTPEPPGKPHVQILYGTYIFIWGGC